MHTVQISAQSVYKQLSYRQVNISFLHPSFFAVFTILLAISPKLQISKYQNFELTPSTDYNLILFLPKSVRLFFFGVAAHNTSDISKQDFLWVLYHPVKFRAF